MQLFSAEDMNDQYKFLQVEVTEVINPHKYPLIFELYYQVPNNEKILLGSFSLYPADNPGKFIVPTQRKLQKAGWLTLSLVTPENASFNDTLRITTTKMKFIKE
jgi:hypothetical protein